MVEASLEAHRVSCPMHTVRGFPYREASRAGARGLGWGTATGMYLHKTLLYVIGENHRDTGDVCETVNCV
jgi:hypothetical protein